MHNFNNIKIALAQLNYHVGNFEANTNKMLAAIEEGKSNSVDIIVFSELSLCGYPPRDFLEFDDFILNCEKSIEKIASHCLGIACILGAPARNRTTNGKKLFNAAYFICDGKIQSIHHKSLLPTYDVFDEYRYFEPGREWNIVAFKNINIAITVCEDLWNTGENKMYDINPMEKLAALEPNLIINISASPFAYDHVASRQAAMKHHAQKHQIPLIYVNHVGAQTELIFDGGSFVLNGRGELILEATYFEEDFKVFDLSGNYSALQSEAVLVGNNDTLKYKLIKNALVLGVKDYFRKLGFTKAILGLSGGIDSALVLALAVEALGSDNVLALLMPSKYSSDHSISDAINLVENLGCNHEIININEAVSSFENTLESYFKNTKSGIAEENIQARARAVLLLAFSNKFGHILLNTSNKSEMAVGYGTLYGDMCGGISVIGDLYKTEVYALSRFINSEKEIIPVSIINKEPSAELKPDQKDSDSLPPYAVLDSILYQYIENQTDPADIIASGFEEKLVRSVLKMVNTNEYKRHQTPPVLRVSKKAFGMGRRLPIVGKYLR